MRILLAEDEKALSNALVEVLKRNNYSVDAVFNGCDALDYLDSDIYDVVILDIMMPKLDGISVLRQMRKAGNKAPVILLTAKSEINDKVTGLDAGADDYLTKPFSMQELLARLRALTRRKDAPCENVLNFGDISLDLNTFELKGRTTSFRLGHKEFQMMEMLMSTPKNVISAEKFMEKIWGFDSDSEINVVWVYLSYLRKKLSLIGSSVQIKVNRNIGYSLEFTND